MNVTLHPNEHSCGSSMLNANTMEFKDCLNVLEVEDLCSSGLHFTWTKNLHKAKVGVMTGILKKLDRVMSNEVFINQYPQANAKFLPYIISDHIPSILCIPSDIIKKIKDFRFLTISLTSRSLSLLLNNGNVFKRVKDLRMKLKDVQCAIDTDPHNHQFRIHEANLGE
ncbi:hypothetical protein Tco_1199254 [Tanacetum coccineum]